jgi:hypothetical protein
VVKRGRVVEQGTHDELLAVGGVYHTLVQMQQMQGAASEDEEEDALHPGSHLEAVPEVSGAACWFYVIARLASWRTASFLVREQSTNLLNCPRMLPLLLPCGPLTCRTCLRRRAPAPQWMAAPPLTGPAPRARRSQLPWAPFGRRVGTGHAVCTCRPCLARSSFAFQHCV